MLALTTSKIPEETTQQYMAWLLYSETGSIPKMVQAWERLRMRDGEMTGFLGQPTSMFKPLPIMRNVERWSSKYQWVERAEQKHREDMDELDERIKKIILKKKYEIVILFDRVLNLYKKQTSDPNHHVTVSELKTIWEMARVELGEPIGRHVVTVNNEYHYEPPDPEDEDENSPRNIALAFKEYYEKKQKNLASNSEK